MRFVQGRGCDEEDGGGVCFDEGVGEDCAEVGEVFCEGDVLL